MKAIKRYIIPIGILVLIDQIIKLLIKKYAFEANLDLIGKLVRFWPVINTKMSWGGTFFSFLSSFWLLIIINMLAYPILISGYLYFTSKPENVTTIVKNGFIACMAGITCSLIDKLFWGGSLDYIELPHLFTFDLKDCYLTTFEIILVIESIIHSKEYTLKEYITFCKG